MLPSCFITGTDTDAGKTLVAASLLRYLANNGVSAAGLKPIASGFESVDGELKNHDIESLISASGVNIPSDLVNLYAFEPAIAPHIAAQDQGVVMSIDAIERSVDKAKQLAERVIVEGVGGWRVPLNCCEQYCNTPCLEHTATIASLAKQLNLPVVLVVGLRLGCLNHALLSAHSIIDDGLPLIGWVANNVQGDFARKNENLLTLRQQMPAPMLFEVPYLRNESELNSFMPPVLAI